MGPSAFINSTPLLLWPIINGLGQHCKSHHKWSLRRWRWCSFMLNGILGSSWPDAATWHFSVTVQTYRSHLDIQGGHEYGHHLLPPLGSGWPCMVQMASTQRSWNSDEYILTKNSLPAQGPSCCFLLFHHAPLRVLQGPHLKMTFLMFWPMLTWKDPLL